jgi:zinc transporter, ZIP family
MSFLNLLAGAFTALAATALGASGVLGTKRIDGRLQATAISFCAGMMGFIALEMIDESHALSGHRAALLSLLGGMTAFLLLDRLLPHAHLLLLGSEMPRTKRKIVLLVGTITLHNIPEGFAIAAAFARSTKLGWLTTLTLAAQDVPEGLIVAAPIAGYGLSKRRSFAWGVFSGVVECVAAIAAFLFLRAASAAMPASLGFSGGAMLYVIVSELLPDAMQAESRFTALGAFIAGIAAAFALSALLGS